MTPPPGLPPMIGRFRVLELLGRGAMGVVYRGIDEILDRPVALKVMAGHGIETDARMRFRREAQAAAKLQHPNIITIYELGDHQGAPFMALELLEGQDLQRAIEAGIRPDPKATLPVILQILAGLGHAHERGIVHRDIKPSNIFLPRRRPAKIMDFGVARLAGGATTAGMVIGTPNYMSPEQVRAGDLDGRSDLFSVGLMLYELVTGEKAFRADSVVALMYKIAHTDVDLSPIPRGPGWDRVRSVLQRGLAREANNRYPDARAMSAELATALLELGGSPDWAMASDLGRAGRTTLRQQPLELGTLPPEEPPGETIALGTAAPVFAAPMALGTAETPVAPAVSMGTAPVEPVPELAPAPRSPWPLAAGLAGAAFLILGATFLAFRKPTVPPPAAAPVTTATPAPIAVASVAPTTGPQAAPSARPSPRPTASTTPPPPATAPPTDLPTTAGGGRVERADALLAAGRYAGALAEARAVLARDPHNDDAQQIAEEAEASLLIETVLKNARQALARGDLEAAQVELRRGLAVNNNDARLLALWREATQ
jgi:serine/threonine-protein kinase